jgi:hypothetical protein
MFMSSPQSRTRDRFSSHKSVAAVAIIAAALLLCAGLYACGSSGSSSSTSSDGTDFRATFIDGLRELTPDLSTSAVNAWSGWSAWSGGDEYSVLNKLFNPASGWESVYGPVEAAEDILEILESNEDLLVGSGTYEMEGEGGTYTFAVSDLSDDFEVPFFGALQTGLTKKVVIESDDSSWRTMVAYHMEGDDKAMVVHQIRVAGQGETEYMAFRANFNETTQNLQIWVAAVADKADSFKLQFVWKGNLDQGTFALTQHTNAAKEGDGSDGFWKVMGGGILEGDMAFRANTNDHPLDDYYIVTTLADMQNQAAPADYPAEAANINSATHAVQGYIDTSHANCLGWLIGFPEVDDLDDWNY